MRIVKSWDAMPPEMYHMGEWFSTRVLEHNYRKMEAAIEAIANQGLNAKQCRNLAVEAVNAIRKQ